MTAYRLVFAAVLTLSAFSCKKDEASSPTLSGRISCNVYSEDTKGSVIDKSGLQTGGFQMEAYVDDDYFQKGDVGTASGKAGKLFGPSDVSWSSDAWSISGDPKWIVLDSTRFWCWFPKTSNGTRTINPASASLVGTNKLTFTYTMPAGGATSGSPALACDATNQEDLLFAYNCRWYDPGKTESSSEEVNFKFYHALSQINFIVYPLAKASQTTSDGSLRSDYKIVDIALSGILSSGSCTITGHPYSDVPSDGAAKTTFDWSNQGTSSTFTQNYGADFSSASSTSVPSGWTYKDYSGKAHYSCNNSFFIIPQTIGNDASLSVTFLNGDTKVTKLATLKGVGATNKGATAVSAWAPGNRYTYRLAISGDITDPTALSVTLEDWDSANDSMRF